jgi:hypothetical protein
MTHFAKVENGIVTNVLVAEQDFIDSGVVGDPSLWVQTSYNTRGNVHYAPNSNTPDNGVPLRANYATVGGVYDAEKNVFYGIQPYSSWILNQTSFLWEAPTPYPQDEHFYTWDEATITWKMED